MTHSTKRQSVRFVVMVSLISMIEPISSGFAQDSPSQMRSWAERVIQSADAIEDREQQLSVQVDLANVYAWMGEPMKACEAAKAIAKTDRDGLTMRAARYAMIALREAGLEEQIDEMVESAEQANERNILSYGLMDVYLYAGRMSDAQQYAGTDKSGRRYRVLATLYCKHKMYPEAAELLDSKFSDQESRDKALAAMVTTCFREGATEKAKQFLDQIKSSKIRRQTASIALLQANEGANLDEHRERYATLKDRRAKSEAAPRLASLLIKAERLEEAAEVIENAVDAIKLQPTQPQTSKFGTYGDVAAIAKVRIVNYAIATAWWKRKEIKKSNTQFELADTAYRKLEPQAALVKWMMDEVRISTLIELDRIDEVVTQLEQSDDDRLKDSLARSLVVYFIERGEADRGLAYAEEIKPRDYKRKDVAVALLENVSLEQAISLIETFEKDAQVSIIRRYAAKAATNMSSAELERIFDAWENPLFRCHFAAAVFDNLQTISS